MSTLPVIDRRQFLKKTVQMAAGISAAGLAWQTPESEASAPPLFKISLAEWSLHRSIFGPSLELGKGGDWMPFIEALHKDPQSVLQGDLNHLDFARTARQFGIEAVEYVNTFFFGRAQDTTYLQEMKDRADSEGVKSVLIMCDDEGNIGDPDLDKRRMSVENHYKWIEAAAFLGCHSIRVNARSVGSYEEQQKLAADGLHQLAEYGDKQGINILVENHGGLSSNGQWLAGVMQLADHPRVGTLPDFGNFNISESERYDIYQGVSELMPFAKGVSAKSHDFDENGEEADKDYRRLLKIVLDAGYHEYVGIEYEGKNLSENDGIQATKVLLEKIRDEISA